MTRVQDIQCQDYSLYKQFLEKFLQGDYSSALSILSSAQFADKKVVASMLNELNTLLTDLQNLYYENVEEKLAWNLEDYNDLVNQLRDRMTYSSSESYILGNIVHYNSSLYVCISETAILNKLPTNTTYWVELEGIKGADGAFGLNLNIRYDWMLNTQYMINDVVWYEGALYFAAQNNINVLPTNTAYWGSLFGVLQASIIVSDTEPSDNYTGQIWFEEVV